VTTKPTLNSADTSFLDQLIEEPKIRRILASVVLMAIKSLKDGANTAIVPLVSSFSAYEEYLNKTYSRVSTIKTFADPTKPVSLLDHFVATNLTNNGSRGPINQDDIRSKLSKNGKIVISALAGFGKSVLLRYLALSFYENPAGKIPIFIELRDLNRIKDPDLISYIHSTYRQNSALDRAVFERGLENGLFVLFLDGFDEVNHENRDEIQGQIVNISTRYPSTSIALSSRPDPKFDSWEKFTTYKILPMSFDQVKMLIDKIDYDVGLKKRFINKLQSGLFNKHRSFVSTPLLATLMMLTYEQNANIPEKMHLFYLRAFETLFDKHDTYKEQYERKRKSRLRVDQFSKIFSTFCFNSYIEEKFEFSNVEILRYLDEAISFCSYDISADDLLFDLTESVCLLQLEGLFYSFVHRSFQEYFTAFFLCNCAEEFRNEFLDEFPSRPWDTTLSMLFDMSQDRVEVGWVLPKIKSYLEDLQRDRGSLSRRCLLRIIIGFELRVSGKKAQFYRIEFGPHYKMTNILRSFYSSRWSEIELYFTVDQIDEFGEQLCTQLNLDYVSFHNAQENISANQMRLIEFKDLKTIPIRNRLTKILVAESKIIEDIRQSVSDHKIVQQKFLAKFRTAQPY
jgi:hypothetical protein